MEIDLTLIKKTPRFSETLGRSSNGLGDMNFNFWDYLHKTPFIFCDFLNTKMLNTNIYIFYIACTTSKN